MEPNLIICKYINDSVYGGIPLTELEVRLLDTSVFQRLRGLKQLAYTNYVFPSADHSRFSHSLGVLYIMGLMTDYLKQHNNLSDSEIIKLRIAALLHDIGHYPLSHLGESVYGFIEDSKNADTLIGKQPITNDLYQLASSHSKTAHHEHLGAYIVNNNIEIKTLLEEYNLNPEEIGSIFTGQIGSSNNLFSQLLHSSLDADRLDYLIRDSFQTGVKYGLVDLQYLIRLFTVVKDPTTEQKILACNKKGQHVAEHFLMSRYFHYSQVIHHKTGVAFEGLVRCLYIKLLQSHAFIFNCLDDIHKHVNDSTFLNFKDSFLECALDEFDKSTEDEDYHVLYEMFKKRIRPKVVFELKDLYETEPSPHFTVLKWILKNEPQKISECIGHKRWGFNIAPITLEKVHSQYPINYESDDHTEALRDAIKLYDKKKNKISYLGADILSVIGKLSNFKSEFIRIYVFDKDISEEDCKLVSDKISSLLQS